MPVSILAIAPHRNFDTFHALIFKPLSGLNMLKNCNPLQNSYRGEENDK